MDLADIRDEVILIVQDDSYVGATVDGYVNKALLMACEEAFIRGMKVLDTVTTDPTEAFISLSSLTGGFSGILKRVISSSGNAINILPDLETLVSLYPRVAEVGSVEAVALEGSTLWYQKIPAIAETLSIIYYRSPAPLVDNEDVPVDIPEHLQRKLLVNGACWMIFDEIEDDVDGKKVNAQGHFWQSFNKDNKHSGIVGLQEWVGRRRRHNLTSCWRH